MLKSLEQDQKDIIERIKRRAKEKHPDVGPIWDGVADINAYYHSNPRVAWILKEPYDPDSGEGWDHPEFLAKKTVTDIESHLTWRRVNQVMYAIRNNRRFNILETIDKNYLTDIAWLNLSKMPGKSTSSNSYKKEYYSNWSDILKEQIDAYNPNIIIFGNTFDVCKNDLFPNGCSILKKNSLVHTYKYGKQLLLYAYHPGWWGIDDVTYVNSIMEMIENFYRII